MADYGQCESLTLAVLELGWVYHANLKPPTTPPENMKTGSHKFRFCTSQSCRLILTIAPLSSDGGVPESALQMLKRPTKPHPYDYQKC